MKINANIKKKWVAALRSGEYKQGRGWLRQIDAKGVERFCCLGVLCDIYTKETTKRTSWKAPNKFIGDTEYSFGGYTDMPPDNVNKWVGLGDTPWVSVPIKASRKYDSLYGLNDGGSPFKKIADYIEAQL
jgi:hypothetical protein